MERRRLECRAFRVDDGDEQRGANGNRCFDLDWISGCCEWSRKQDNAVPRVDRTSGEQRVVAVYDWDGEQYLPESGFQILVGKTAKPGGRRQHPGIAVPS